MRNAAALLLSWFAGAALAAGSAQGPEQVELTFLPVPGARIGPVHGRDFRLDAGEGPRGTVRVPPRSDAPISISVSLDGLEPDHSYVLCVNTAEPDSPTSKRLASLSIRGWPLGETYRNAEGKSEGHWNFATVSTDTHGHVDQTFALPLPPWDYRIRFLVKNTHREGSASLLYTDAVVVAVAGEATLIWVTGALALASLSALFLFRKIPHIRSRSDPREPAERQEGAAPDATPDPPGPEPALSGADPQDSSQTQVQRARASGALKHDSGYNWVEIHGRRKTFRPRQALVFQILCECDPDCDGMSQDRIVELWEATFDAPRANTVRVRDIFRSCPHEPGDFILRVPGPASVYRLRLEPENAQSAGSRSLLQQSDTAGSHRPNA